MVHVSNYIPIPPSSISNSNSNSNYSLHHLLSLLFCSDFCSLYIYCVDLCLSLKKKNSIIPFHHHTCLIYTTLHPHNAITIIVVLLIVLPIWVISFHQSNLNRTPLPSFDPLCVRMILGYCLMFILFDSLVDFASLLVITSLYRKKKERN